MDTPGSTTPPDASSSSSQTKRRRQVAFYPNTNSSNKPQKPFSRSAAKRESVMALGSIEYLQHYFTKAGIAAESDPLKKPNGRLVPAIGGLASLAKRAGPPADPNFVLPPSPVIPQAMHTAFPPYVKTFETDPENLRPGVIEDLISVTAAWKLDLPQHPAAAAPDPNLLGVGDRTRSAGSGGVDVLELLKTTTALVRTVRNYAVSVPDESAEPAPRRAEFRPQTLSSAPPPRRVSSQPGARDEPPARIRGRAMEVLAVLRELEERARLPLDHDAYDAQSDHGSSSAETNVGPASRGASPSSHLEEPDFLDADTSVSISFVDVGAGGHGHRQVPVWDDEAAYDLNSLSEEERGKRDRWDERLVLGGGWLYRQDVRMEQLERERDVVGKYLDAVDEALFGGEKEGKRGWVREKERKDRQEREARSKGRRVSAGDAADRSEEHPARGNRRVVSTGMLDAMRSMVVTEEPEEMESIEEEESVDDEDLPLWAKRSAFADDSYGRLHALLVALLPANLLRLLPLNPADRAEVLVALSSGQLLCVAYNKAVRKSRKPWGYVSKDAIHDIVALEETKGAEGEGGEGGKRGWTFRRTDNLRLWAAALKLRYSVPIVMPNNRRKEGSTRPGTPALGNSPLPSPVAPSVTFPGVVGDDTIIFDAPLVARMEEGWEIMLERLVFQWVDAVVSDRRGER